MLVRMESPLFEPKSPLLLRYTNETCQLGLKKLPKKKNKNKATKEMQITWCKESIVKSNGTNLHVTEVELLKSTLYETA